MDPEVVRRLKGELTRAKEPHPGFTLVTKVDLRALLVDWEELAEGCTCQECGEQYREDVRLPDRLWNLIRPEGKPEGAGLLCGGCIGKKLGELWADWERRGEALRACIPTCREERERQAAGRRFREDVEEGRDILRRAALEGGKP